MAADLFCGVREVSGLLKCWLSGSVRIMHKTNNGPGHMTTPALRIQGSIRLIQSMLPAVKTWLRDTGADCQCFVWPVQFDLQVTWLL
jgi:hypothetical protein